MYVPEAAVHEDDFAAGGENKVGFFWQVAAEKAVAIAEGVDETADGAFRGLIVRVRIQLAQLSHPRAALSPPDFPAARSDRAERTTGRDPAEYHWGTKTLFVGRVRLSFLKPAARAVLPSRQRFFARNFFDLMELRFDDRG